jgi:hypothetical protein
MSITDKINDMEREKADKRNENRVYVDRFNKSVEYLDLTLYKAALTGILSNPRTNFEDVGGIIDDALRIVRRSKLELTK